MRPLMLALALFAAAVPLTSRPTEIDDAVKVVTDACVNDVHVAPSGASKRVAFHPDFRMLVLTNSAMTAVTHDEWITRMEGGTANAAAARPTATLEVTVFDLAGSAPSVRVRIARDGKRVCTDYLMLYKFPDGWKIVNKAFYAHPRYADALSIARSE